MNKQHAILWSQLMHICVSKIIIVGSDNGLSPGRCQDIMWTNAGILLIGPLGINFSEILIEINTFLFKRMHLKMSSAKWRLLHLSLKDLNHWWHRLQMLTSINRFKHVRIMQPVSSCTKNVHDTICEGLIYSSYVCVINTQDWYDPEIQNGHQCRPEISTHTFCWMGSRWLNWNQLKS